MINRLLFSVLFILLSYGYCDGQKQGQARIDSLLQELPKAKEDSTKYGYLLPFLLIMAISIRAKELSLGKKVLHSRKK